MINLISLVHGFNWLAANPRRYHGGSRFCRSAGVEFVESAIQISDNRLYLDLIGASLIVHGLRQRWTDLAVQGGDVDRWAESLVYELIVEQTAFPSNPSPSCPEEIAWFSCCYKKFVHPSDQDERYHLFDEGRALWNLCYKFDFEPDFSPAAKALIRWDKPFLGDWW